MLFQSVCSWDADQNLQQSLVDMSRNGSKLETEASKASKLTALLDSAVDGIIAIRQDGTIETVNAAATRLFQYSVDEFIGRNIKFLMPQPYRGEHDNYLRTYRRTGERKIIGIGREVVGRRKDGSNFPMHVSVGEFEVDGEIFYTGIVHDLTARKSAEQALQQALKMEAIGQLTGGVAHDFNNLLTVIMGNLELLELRLTDEAQRELVSEAQEAADMGARLTNRLLAFARRSQLEPRPADLNAMVLNLTDMLQRTLGGAVSLNSALSTELWPILVDPAQLENAIINLAINSRDAMPGGGKLLLETGNVTFDEHDVGMETVPLPGDYVRLSITDTGEGMSEEIRKRAFEPFFTTKETGKGTGLGLSMVYGFTKQSGGYAAVYSEPGKGTTINLYLPRHTEDGDMISGVNDTDHMPSGKGELILAVEDDDRVRRLTITRLRALGYRVLEAMDGAAALELLESETAIDLVFTDLVMPGGISGYDLAEQVRQRWPDIRVLLTSGYAEEVINSEKLMAENLQLLRKPYRQSDLARSVRQAIEE